MSIIRAIDICKDDYGVNAMLYDNNTLKKVQTVELQILIVVDDFCRKNAIDYSLAYGTLLGAVRHQGFIPWDDDIDLMMRRDMYDKFIKLWTENPPEGFYLQTDENEPGYPNNFLKVRKQNTTFIQNEKELETHMYRTGIFIDVFPLDRVAPSGLMRKIQYVSCCVNMLLTRDYLSRRPGRIERTLLALPPRAKKTVKKLSYRFKTQWNKSKYSSLDLFWNGTVYGAKKYFHASLCDEYTELPFEGKMFKAVKSYDKYLTSYFGDYLTLPSENKRVNHKPIVLDFDHNYEGNGDEQRA